MRSALLTLLCFTSAALAANLNLVKEYSGSGFFDEWDYYGHWDDLTNGNVIFVNKTDSTSLTYVTPSGQAIVAIDNTTFVPANNPRNAVSISSQDYFEIGTVFVIDVARLPWGCSVWPAIWTRGNGDWPATGEIDIIEGVNRMTFNQMALHTSPGCSAATGTDQTGSPSANTDCSPLSGCTVKENKPNSFGDDFNNNGGGVWAMQFDVSGIFIWFWQRSEIPSSITGASSTTGLDISAWGPPSAAWPSGPSCNISEHVSAQQLVIDITLCGDWAGLNTTYAQTCDNSTYNACYLTNVQYQGTYTDDAYFAINYIRAFAASNATVVPESMINGTSSASGASGASSTGTPPVTISSGASSASSGLSGSPTGGAGSPTQTGGALGSTYVPAILAGVAGVLVITGLSF
ncbi:glycoside hydrolase family 16 protein [Phanerochaete sordida]|uniref:Glycoside hydrolase family 16 protein n=1 Tax=Phanerochaete sordida TaxID=48140 RepID=A0A9P3G4J5_9APHY|nr:glycoside hydrolase family 16 protein [Phanerochaete sordida]